jgi:hypothetical protein
VIRLAGVELRRVLSRRAVRWVYLGLVAILLVFLIHDIVTAVDEQYLLGRQGFDAQEGTLAFAAVAAFLVGATMTGADWATGVFAHVLVWEPRRLRVVGARIVALLISVLVATTLALAMSLALSYVAADRGPSPGVPPGFWHDYGVTLVQGLVVVAFAASAAFGIAGFARSTGAALGFAFGYTVILENALRVLVGSTESWLVTSNIGAAVAGGYTTEGDHRISAGRGVATLIAYAVLLVGAFALSFRQRDVT